MSWRRWKLGAVIAVGCGILSGLAGLAAGMSWQAFVAVLATSLVTHFLSFLKDHPYEQVSFDDSNPRAFVKEEVVNKVGLWLVLGVLVFGLVGCGSPQVTAYKAEGVTITTVDTAMRAYADYSHTHAVSQAEVDRLRGLYDKYFDAQQVAKLALETYTAAATEGNGAALKAAQENVASASAAVIDLVKGVLR